jgi:hypothetical protein
MTDYRDPNYRAPNRPAYPEADPSEGQAWSNATWGWIAGIAVAVLVLIFIFGSVDQRTATDQSSPPAATTGQRANPPAPPSRVPNEAPTMIRPAPAPAPNGQK